MPRLTSGSSVPSSSGGVSPVRTTVYHVPRRANAELFTESALVYLAKTTWARLRTPRAIATYEATLRQLFALLGLTCQLVAEVTVTLARYAWEWTLWAAEAGRLLVGRVWRALEARRRAAVDSQRVPDNYRWAADRTPCVPGSERRATAGSAWSQHVRRQARSRELRQAQARARPMARPHSAKQAAGRVVAPGARAAAAPAQQHRRLAAQGCVAISWGWLGVLSLARRMRRAGALRTELNWPWRTWSCRYRFACLALFQSVLFLLAGPVAVDMVASLSAGAGSRIAALSRPEAPRMELPRFSVPTVTIRRPTLPEFSLPDLAVPKFSSPRLIVPELALQLPGFILGPVRKLDAMLAGPLIEAGARVLVADVAVPAGAERGLDQVLALLIEAELAQAQRFAVVPRERALAGRRASGFALTTARALELAPATGAAVVIAGELVQEEGEEGERHLALTVLEPAGAELYRVETPVDERGIFEALDESVRQLLGRLGAVSEAKHATSVLSPSLPALCAYARARAHLRQGRYNRAIAAAGEAVRHDSAFASTHRLLADAYALAGQQSRARASLETAWRHRERLSERERLRVAADRQALAGRYSEAIVAYDRLFARYRDDVGALKSQAILQAMIGARGGGLGNLQVAYSIDPVDWPPLQRVARFLGYRGRLPDVSCFVAASD